jgi:hypothetical protein
MSNPAKRGWDAIVIGTPNPSSPMVAAYLATDGRKHHYRYRHPQRAVDCRAFWNRLYNGIALTFEDGSMHISFKRNDRAAVRDWRHFQAIKNEVAGADREAIELFPPEAHLVDAANEYHLWVLPPDIYSPLGMLGRGVGDAHDNHDQAGYRSGLAKSGSRQREWEPGIPTGPGREAE